MVPNALTLHQLVIWRVTHKVWRTLLHYRMDCPLQLLSTQNCHSHQTLRVVVIHREFVDHLIATDIETMRGGDVVY